MPSIAQSDENLSYFWPRTPEYLVSLYSHISMPTVYHRAHGKCTVAQTGRRKEDQPDSVVKLSIHIISEN